MFYRQSRQQPTWVMPQYLGVDIADHLETVAVLKRAGSHEAALDLATGCMDAMIQVARINPANALEHYVVEVAIILRKLRRYGDEVAVIGRWLDLEIPPPRADIRLELLKRQAKAGELLAKQQGRDSALFTAAWREYIAQEKALKESPKVSSAGTEVRDRRGRELNAGGLYQRTDSPSNFTGSPSRQAPRKRLLPPRADLLAPEFVAVDFETANRRGGVSACQVALVKVSGGQVVDRFVTYLKPPAGWDRFEFTWLHGITRRDTERAPAWQHVAGDIADFVGSMPVYAHNAVFDSRVWGDLDAHFGVNSQPAKFYCTYRMAKHMYPGLKNYKLPTVTGELVPGYQLRHHKADSDAEACALIVAALQHRENTTRLL